MICDRKPPLYLETKWRHGELYVMGPNRVMDLLLAKARRQDRIWAIVNSCLSWPLRIFGR